MATTEVKVQINADGSQVPREADKVKKSLVGIGKEGEALSKSFAKVGGVIAGALSVGAITSFLSRVNQAADQLDGLSQRLGASASGLQTLQIAAAQAGGSAEAMNNALAKMSVSLGDALAGSKPVNEALAKLGLTAKELAGLRADESMRRIAGALSDVGNTYERAAISQAIFGKGAKELQEFFAVAPGQISETEQALADAGATLDDIDVAKIGLMNDQLAMQSTIVANLGVKFLANLSPAIGVATESFANIIRTMGGATEAGKTFGVVMTGAIKLVEAGIFGLAAVFETLRGIGAVVFASLTNAVGNLIGVLARAAEIANLDIAQPLRAASNATLSLGTSFSNVAASAFDNAKAASAGAITAGLDLLRASEIFAAASDAALAKAEQAVARTQAIQGQVSPGAADAAARASGAAGAAGAGSRGGPLLSKDLLKDTGRAIADFDPLADPQVLRQIEINSALQAVQDAHDQTMLGKIDLFNQTALGSLLNFGQQQIDFEQNKNIILGELAANLANTAIAAGGKLGKFGKALAIAQTIWSTGQAIMKAWAELGPIKGGVAAALIAAQGVAQLANIRKTNIGSGGSIAGARGGGISASAPSLNDNVAGAQPQQQEQAVTQVVIQGNVFSSQETASWIIEQIRDAVQTRDVVFISSNSRQAMELAGT
jgi:hypothetical protein